MSADAPSGGTPPKKRYCTMCGVREVEIGITFCDSCKERLREEAMGGKHREKQSADRALKQHGVTPKDGGGKG